MPIQTAIQRENTATVGYTSGTQYAALYTTLPGAAQGVEPSGGSPAYARKQITWLPGGVDGVLSATVVFDVPANTDVRAAGIHTSLTGGTYLDGATLAAAQFFSGQGTFTLSLQYIQT